MSFCLFTQELSLALELLDRVLGLNIYTYMYMYIYIERERARDGWMDR